MKKIVVFSLLLVLVSAAASAQRLTSPHSIRPRSNQVTWGEKKELRKDAIRYRLMKRKAGRDGVVTRIERKRLHRAKSATRRDAFRFRHNGRRRVI